MAKAKVAKIGEVCSPQGCRWFLAVVLVVGLLYLLRDLALVDLTYNIQWYTVLFVLVGAAFFCKSRK